jgi:hypothetical protein
MHTLRGREPVGVNSVLDRASARRHTRDHLVMHLEPVLIRRMLLVALASASLALPAFSHAAGATDVAGVKYDNAIQLGGSTLLLNGAGIRYKAIFKVYAAGLYLATRATTPEAVLAAHGPKRIHLVMLRSLDANEFGKILSAGIEKNSTRQEFIEALPAIMKMGEASVHYKTLAPGDTLTIDWVPGVGTSLYVKGNLAAGPYKDAGFFSAMAKIWFGKSPADAQLKSALLGGAPKDANDPFN